MSLSGVSYKAVERGKKTPQELEQEARTASQSEMDGEQTTAGNEQDPSDVTTTTPAETSNAANSAEQTEQTSAPENNPEDEKDENKAADYAEKVVRSA